MTRGELVELLRVQRREQGLPPKVSNPATLRRLAALLAAEKNGTPEA